MLDFTSALYLGFEHPSWSLPGWPRLTLGKPGALEALPGTVQAQQELAALTGCERVMLGTSTLHLFCDLFSMLARRSVAIWIDEAAYPIARWGTDRAAASGVPVRVFPAHNIAALRRALDTVPEARPVIVTDGYCPIRGKPAPLRDYARYAAAAGGLLIVDDTQALGVLGRRVDRMAPYGIGGGGSLRYFNLSDPRIVVVSSLAKAFGVPVAMLGGSQAWVEEFRESSATLVHCSPPSAATIAAALRALEINRRQGDVLRRRLAERVVRFRRALPDLVAAASLFPVQPLKLPERVDSRAVYRALVRRGVVPVLHRDPGGGPRISFVLNARHRLGEIDRAVETLWAAGARGCSKNERSQRQCLDVIEVFNGCAEAGDGPG
jgi:8-amino-7-oxononanoate synthase